MSVRLFAAMTLTLLLSTVIMAEETGPMKVAEMVFCTEVEERVPMAADTSFTNDVNRVFCFTKITGATDTTRVSHVWYYNNEEMAEVTLKVGAKSWRTWSSKAIWEGWVGKWRVNVVSADGAVLESKEFEITAPKE